MSTKPDGPGWQPWLDPYGIARQTPHDYVEVEAWREGWEEPQLVAPGENPIMNTMGLWWRPASPPLTPKAVLAQMLTGMLFGRRA